MTAITGNTYPVREHLKALGAKWDPEQKAWMVPDEQAEKAREIMRNAPLKSTKAEGYRPTKCVVCGVVARRNPRGYMEPKIYRNGECADCWQERNMGY